MLSRSSMTSISPFPNRLQLAVDALQQLSGGDGRLAPGGMSVGQVFALIQFSALAIHVEEACDPKRLWFSRKL